MGVPKEGMDGDPKIWEQRWMGDPKGWEILIEGEQQWMENP